MTLQLIQLFLSCCSITTLLGIFFTLRGVKKFLRAYARAWETHTVEPDPGLGAEQELLRRLHREVGRSYSIGGREMSPRDRLK